MEIDFQVPEFIQRLIAAVVEANAELLESVVMEIPESYRGTLLRSIGESLLAKFQRTGSMEHLHYAIKMMEKAVELTTSDDPNHPIRLHLLGVALQARFERTGSMADLCAAIEKAQEALKSAILDNLGRSVILNSLGMALQRRFETTGSIEQLQSAIQIKRDALQLAPTGHPIRAMCLNNMAIGLQARFETLGLAEDLIDAIEAHEQGLELTTIDDSDRAMNLSGLVIALTRLSTKRGSLEDIDRAIQIGQQVIASIPIDKPNRAPYLATVADAFGARFDITGSTEDVQNSIELGQEARRSIPADHPSRPAILHNLGNSYRKYFEMTGSIKDIDDAIDMVKTGIESTPMDHPKRAGQVNSLASMFLKRFEHTAAMSDLDYGIMIQEQVVQSTPPTLPDRSGFLNNLAVMLQRKFERTDSLDHLDRAILMGEQAIESTSTDQIQRSICLANLGIGFQRRFRKTGKMEDINQAIKLMQQALESGPIDSPGAGLNVNNMGAAFQERFIRGGSLMDIDNAIQMGEQAVKLIPIDTCDHAMCLNNLGSAFYKRFRATGSTNDLERAIDIKELVAKVDTGKLSVRLEAAHYASELLIQSRRYKRAKSILQSAVQLFPRISPRYLNHKDAQFNISQFQQITSRAVSLCLEDNDDVNTTLRLLELGRGILANLQLEVRSDISDLAASHPGLAQQFKDLREKIDPPSRSFICPDIAEPSTKVTSKFVPPDLRELQIRFDALLAHIRSLEGFKNFLQGPSEISPLAKDGAIVVFNVSDIRSDAFLITTGNVRSIHLPLLTQDVVKDYVTLLYDAIYECGTRQQHQAIQNMNQILEGLWDRSINSILEELGFTRTPESHEEWPRVWWIGSSLLSVLPIHAAGYHEVSEPHTCLDRVISSYAPTLKSLAYAKEKAFKVRHSKLTDKAIILAMPTTPGESTLSFVAKEANDIKSLLAKASINTTVLMNPTKAEVLKQLLDHNIVHFSCHGHSALDPSESSLHMQDWKIAPLTVIDFASLNLEFTKLAYLAACHTSLMRDSRLFDESITLSSALQLSGYPSVIGTMWSISDMHSVDVAREVYSILLEGDGRLNTDRTAEGLHWAIRRLRERTRIRRKQDPLTWASFIYIGC